MSKPKYDSTVARIAGNLLSGYAQVSVNKTEQADTDAVQMAVSLARDIVREVQRTQPDEPQA